MDGAPCGAGCWRGRRGEGGLLRGSLCHHALELVRVYLHKLREHRVPAFEDPAGARTLRRIEMTIDEIPQDVLVFGVEDMLQFDRGLITTIAPEFTALVEHISDAARHARSEVSTGLTEHDDHTVRHVFAAVIAHTLDDGGGAGIAHREAFAGDAVEKRLATGGAVQHHIADQDILLGHEGGVLRRIDDNFAAGEALAHVVVGVAFEFERDTSGEEGPETLAGRTGELALDRIVRQAGGAVLAGDLAR